MTDKQDRIVILGKGYGPKWQNKFFKDIEEAILQGYRIADTNLRADCSMRNFKGNQGKAVLYLEGKEPDAFVPIEAEVVVQEDMSIAEDNIITPAAPENPSLEEKEVEEAQALVDSKQAVRDTLEATEGYKELKDFAVVYGIDVSSNLKNPKAIKKYLRVALEEVLA